MISTVSLTREYIDTYLHIALLPVARAMFDIAVNHGEPVTETLKILAAQRITLK